MFKHLRGSRGPCEAARGRHRHAVAAALPLLAVFAATAGTAAPPTERGARLYAPCAACHGVDAWGSTDGRVPSLAGQQTTYLEHELALFRSAVRVDDAMQTVATHVTLRGEGSVAALARYLAALPRNPHPVLGPGSNLESGSDAFEHICAGCHGARGEGNPANRVPRIAGQNYPYLRAQIEQAARLHRELAPPEMAAALRGLTPVDRDALADFIARLGEPPRVD